MQVHGSCASKGGSGVLLIGPPGSGKSDLLLRLLDRGFSLVADDRVDIEAGVARPPPNLAGLLEVRGLGIVRLAHVAQTCLALAVTLGAPVARLPQPARHPILDLPLIAVEAHHASAPAIVELALNSVLARVGQVAGAFLS
jgi:HPr kinase/phosphorylase